MSTIVQVVIGFLGFAILSIQISQPTFNWRCVKSKVLHSILFIQWPLQVVAYAYGHLACACDHVCSLHVHSHLYCVVFLPCCTTHPTFPFKQKLIFGSLTPFHVATSSSKSTNAQIVKDTFPIHQLEPS
jgi:hypothetical protein